MGSYGSKFVKFGADAYGKTVITGLNFAGRALKTVAHGIVGGLSSKLSGGSFSKSFLSTAFVQAFAPGIDKLGGGMKNTSISSVSQRVGAAAVLGGVASKLIGGSFSMGARLGAMSRFFNDEAGVVNLRKKFVEWKIASPRTYKGEWYEEFTVEMGVGKYRGKGKMEFDIPLSNTVYKRDIFQQERQQAYYYETTGSGFRYPGATPVDPPLFQDKPNTPPVIVDQEIYSCPTLFGHCVFGDPNN